MYNASNGKSYWKKETPNEYRQRHENEALGALVLLLAMGVYWGAVKLKAWWDER